MIKCKRCKVKFGSITAYGIHTWMVEKVGRKKVCPSIEKLKEQGMHKWHGEWFFLSPEFVAEHKEEIEEGEKVE